MDERMKFVGRHLEGERIADLCREFGISRTTGHAIIKRHRLEGPSGLRDRSSRPLRSPHKTPSSIADEVIALRRKRPTWGPKKLKERLHTLHPGVRWPASSTIGAILTDEGLVKGRKRRRRLAPAKTTLRETHAPNELWCMDYKGQFRLGNREYCYPFTVTDHHSRFVLCCDALENTAHKGAYDSLVATFHEYGLPAAIRSDNGAPFASSGRLRLSKLSVWLMRLGIAIERIEPGKPQQNGRHERMHLTLKAETTRPPAHGFLAQQEKFDGFCETFNDVRPHEALGMKTPVNIHAKSARPLPAHLPDLDYPLHDLARHVVKDGTFQLPQVGRFYIGTAFAGHPVGLRQLEAKTWLVSFVDIELGYLDVESKKVFDPPTPINTPPAPKV